MTDSKALNNRHYPAEIWSRLWPFFAVMGLFWLVSAYWWTQIGYLGTFEWINQHQIALLDNAALYFFTHLGDGIILPAIAILFFWRKNPAFAIALIVGILLTGLATQIGKTIFFADWYRPPRIFEGNPLVHIWHPAPPRNHSFPSGHATSIATAGVFFAYQWSENRKWISPIIGLFTIFLCFTRVLIGVHFPGDIFVGSIIGSIGAVLILRWMLPWLQEKLKGLNKHAKNRTAWILMGIVSVIAMLQWIHLMWEL